MTTDGRAGHTPEPWDLYKHDGDIFCYVGRHVSVADPAYKHNIFGRHECYHVTDNWFKSAPRVAAGGSSASASCLLSRSSISIFSTHYLGNAMACVNACAGLGRDPAARIAELLEAEKQRNDYRILAAHPATRGDVVPAAPLRALVDKMWSDADLANMTADSEMATRDWGVAIDRILREHGVDKEPDAAAPEFDPTAKPIWETVVAIGAKIPESEWDSVPKPQDAECAHCGGDLVMLCPKCTRFNVTVQNTEPPDAADPAAKEKPDEC